MPAKTQKQLRKEKVWNTIQDCSQKYAKVLFVDVDNVTSKQICIMRKALRALDSTMVMGKNTLIRKALTDLIEKNEGSPKCKLFKTIMDQMNLNTGLIYTNGDLAEIKAILDSQNREAPARIGSMAPAEVIIPAGATGLDPKQTSFFQALNIQTKIVKGQVEIVNPVTVIKEDDKITAGQAALLDKLKIRPFEYKMHIKNYLDNGKLYDAKVLSINTQVVLDIFSEKSQLLTGLSLGSGFLIPSAAPHLMLNAFKNLAAISFSSGYKFPQADKLMSAAAAAPKAAGGAAKPAAAAKVEEPEEEEDVDMGGLFGDEY